MDQSEKIALQNNNNSEFTIPYDLVPLPSEGILYPNKKDTLKVEYLTASKENILTSPNLIRSGKVLDKLMEMCVKDTDIKIEDLLTGDRNAIMIFLRVTGYGNMYPVKITDPESGEEFETKVNLSKLESKSLGAKPDENMEFDFFLPKLKKKIKFKLLTSKDEQEIIKKVDALSKLNGNTGISTLLTTRLSRMIRQIEDKRDNIYIQQFVENMPASDSLAFRLYIDKIEPGIDLEYEFESPSGRVFKQQVPINVDFFFPSS